MKVILKKDEGESYLSYIKRIAELKRLDKIGYDELGDLLLGSGNVYSSENIRKFWYIFDKIIDNVDDSVDFTEEDLFLELDRKKQEIQRERYKLQAEKVEINKWLREDAREELFIENIINSIKSVKTEPCDIKKIDITYSKRYGVLNFADCHFAKDFKIYGLNNEVINEYSPEIFFKRMEVLFNETVSIVKKEGFSHIKIFSLGDVLDGFIRNSQIWSLRYGVTDSAIIYAKYVAKWLKDLSKIVAIEYHQTGGNHTELRLLDGKKGEHSNENIEKIISEIIQIRNEDNINFTYVENKTGYIFTNIAGYNVLGIHGEVKDLSQAVKDFSDIYNVDIDYIVAGHKHHATFVNCGYRKGAIGVGSIVGSDDFSMRIRKQADATATFLVFEEGKGKVLDYTIVLN